MTRSVRIFLSAAVVLGTLASTPVRAELLDRVVATLDEEAFFLSDVERRARPFLAEIPADTPASERAQLRQRVLRDTLDRMIDDALIRQAATRLHVSVTDEDVDQFIERIARERGATAEQVRAALEREGVQWAEYRGHMESEVRRLKVLQLRVRGRINVTEADLQEAYRRFVRENSSAAALRASHLFFNVPAEATPEQAEAVRTRAALAAERARAGEDFATLAASLSEDEATKNAGGDLGEIEPGMLPETLDAGLRTLSDGAVSDPVRGPNGYHVLRVTGRRALAPPRFEEVRERLYALLLNREMMRHQEIYLRELRRNAAITTRFDAPPTR